MTLDAWLHNRFVTCVAFIGLTLAPIMIVFGGVVLPVRDEFAARDAKIAQQSEMLARLKGIADYSVTPMDVEEDGGKEKEYLIGSNEGIANAKLQARLKGLTQAAGARLQSVQGLPVSVEGPLRLIGAKLNIFGPLQAVHQAIFAIEDNRPYFFITNAVIRVSRQVQRPGAPSAEPVIDAELDVFGAFKLEGSP